MLGTLASKLLPFKGVFSLSLLIESTIECNMHLRKVSPQCNALVHVKWSVRGCRHAFSSKRKAQCTANQPVKRRRTFDFVREEGEKEGLYSCRIDGQ